MCPEARETMARICASFIERWDFDGAKYDLFNCVPNMRCCSADHDHDVTSMLEGLELTLKRIDEVCRALKSDYIVELKQNYATPFLARYGTMTRAGDTPYNSEGNFLRTLYVQGYSPFAVNDYQTVTNADSPQAAACMVIKMMAVGIPAYSIDFDRLCRANKDVIGHYNRWYNDNVRTFMRYRVPLDWANNVLTLKTSGEARDVFFLVNDGGPVRIDRPATVLNATFKTDLFVELAAGMTAEVTTWDCFGAQSGTDTLRNGGWSHLNMLPGGMLRIEPIA